MLAWPIAAFGLLSLALALLWRRGVRRHEELETRVSALEKRLDATAATSRRSAEAAAAVRQLLFEKGLASAQDFDDGKPEVSDAPVRDRGLH